MRLLIWGAGLSLLLPFTAIAGDWAPAPGPVRMCQTYRFKDGVAVKIGKPRPCKKPSRHLTLAWNSRGGAVLPQ